MGNPKTFSFTLKNDLAELKILCQQLESIGGALGLPQRFLFEINLALDELFTNIISYGFNDRSEHAIQVCIAADDGMLTITVEDGFALVTNLEAEGLREGPDGTWSRAGTGTATLSVQVEGNASSFTLDPEAGC